MTMKRKIEIFEILESHCADEVKIEFDPSKYEMVERSNGYYVVKKKPNYPQTYEECCAILGLHQLEIPTAHGYKAIEIEAFQQLIICRDAYWKIAGEELGLGEPWKPNWKNGLSKFCIATCEDQILRCNYASANFILAFPTEEMRDAFYENFKELIEQCEMFL